MAKKKAEKVESEAPDEELDKMTVPESWAGLEKEFGVGVLTDASVLVDEEQEILSITPCLDSALSGGIPTGSWVSVSGDPKTGKTSSALNLAASAQQKGMMVYYLDVEHRLKKMHLTGIRGLDLSPHKFQLIRSNKEKIYTGKDFLNIASHLLYDQEHIAIIIDSISCLSGEAEMTKGLGTESRGGEAKLLAQFTRLVQAVVPVRKSVVVGMTHIIANTSGFGSPRVERAGSAWQYQADVRIQTRRIEPWRLGQDETGKQIGQVVTWKVWTSALGPPGAMAETWLRYGVGYDRVYERLMQAIDLGLIKRAGAWFSLPYLLDRPDLLGLTEGEVPDKPPQFQGAEKLSQAMTDHPDWFAHLETKVLAELGLPG